MRTLEHFQHFLLLLQLQRQVSGNGIGQATGIINAGQRSQNLGRNFLVEFDVLIELREKTATHRLDLVIFALFLHDQFGFGDEVGLGIGKLE